MGSARMSWKRTLLTSAVLSLSLLSGVMAQDGAPPPGGDDKTSTSVSTTETHASSTTSTSESIVSTASTSSNTIGQVKTITNTNTNTASTSSTNTAKVPTITGGSQPTQSNDPEFTSLPVLSKTRLAIPTYPAPSVPPTRQAPFMNKSTAPDGTVFIAVGAILGAFGLAILLWRGIVACLLHRSVERAAAAQHAANDKAAYPGPPQAPFYKYTDRDSSPSLAVGSASGRGQRRTNRGPIPSGTPSQTNLFFSPTASGSMGNNSNRDSRFLPSGFYASASSAGHAQGTSLSLNNLRPVSRGQPLMGPSPPDSPATRPTPATRNFSTSSVNLNRPPSGRAPSAYLDDLLDEQGHQFPPGHFPPPHQHSHGQSQSSLGRF